MSGLFGSRRRGSRTARSLSSVDKDNLAPRINPLGRHTVWAPASAMTGESGREPLAVARKLGGGLMVSTLEFFQNWTVYAQFALTMPKGWDAGDLTVRLLWTAEYGAGTVRWGVQAAALGDNDALDAAFSAAVAVEDTLLAADDLHETPESAAVAPAGDRANASLVQLCIYRDATHANDTLTAGAQLLGARIRFGIDAANDD